MSSSGIVNLSLFSAVALLFLCFVDVVTPTDVTRGSVLGVFLEVDKYFRDTGELPPSLEALRQRAPKLSITDGWGWPLHYSFSDTVITVASYGLDGKAGGSGWNTDRSMSYYVRRPDGQLWIGTDGWILQARQTHF